MIEQLKGQMSIEEVFGPDIWSGKTCPEPLAQTKAKTSEPSSKKQRKSSVKMPLFLDLRGASGVQAVASWVTGGVLLGEFTMHSFGECPSVENVSLLSQILEENPLPKYSLSARACAGILRRAESRGKKLPELLEETLKRQSASKSEPDAMGGARESSYSMSEQEPCQHSTIKQYCLNNQGGSVMGVSEDVTGALRAQEHGHQPIVYGISSYDSNAMKSNNPNSGIYEAKTARTLDLNGGSPACNQGGIAILYEAYQHHGYRKGEAVNPLTRDQNESIRGDTPLIVAPAYIYDEEQAQTLVAKGSGGVLATNQAIGEYKITGVASSLKQRDYKDATDLVISQTTGESVNNGK